MFRYNVSIEEARTTLWRCTLKKDKPTTTDEKNLIKLCKEGDRRALRELYHRYRGLVMKIAYPMIRNLEAAKDIMHDVFMKVFTHVKTFDEKSTFSAWIWTITRNICIDRIRKEKRAASTEYLDTLEHDDTRLDIRMHASIPSPEEVCLHHERNEHIATALETLSPKHRAVFEMRELHGMSYEEIALTLGLPMGTVMSRLFHARQSMEQRLSLYARS